ncbi:Conserved_hypothetical protein [Hexamita inflata]|uniref:Cilia- and flagella-associated protein 91 n=2 Tax=Hexamita inflata TaxID=28002 RepID=A0AA86NIS3_9EUKA|nr:Conserved hypothetical protein [Hexamita inflata]CAI9958646.1 Conserved hypothetical protein [Hexamita inflata]
MSLFAPTQQDVQKASQLPQHPVPYRQGATQISVGVQTDLRETGIQTDPWTAKLSDDSEVPDNQQLLDLLELTFANGLLPAHQETMKVIDRIREEKEFEKQIPPPLDPTRRPTSADQAQEQKRIQMLIDKDILEWSRKEGELQKQHARRIKLLMDQLETRETARQDLRNELLDRLTVTKNEQLTQNSLKLTQQAVLQLKKTTQDLKTQIQNQKTYSDQNVVSDRLTYKSHTGDPSLTLPQQRTTKLLVNQCIYSANSLNAPVLKPGEAPYRFAGVIRLAGTELKTSEDFNEILQFQSQMEQKTEMAKPRTSKSIGKNYAVQKDTNYLPPRLLENNILEPPNTKPEWLRNTKKTQLKQIQQQLKQTIVDQNKVVPVYKQFEMPPDITESDKNDAALFVQNLIRGKATQNKLENGKDRRIGLVNELRLAHALVQTRSQEENLQKVAQDRFKLIHDAIVSGVVVQGVGSGLGQTLDQMQKDRTRQQQVMRAQAILQIAMRERQRREKLESEERQKEVMHRSRNDYNRQVIQTAHREFVDMLIDQLSKQSATQDAEAQAKDLALRQIEALVELDYQRSKADAQNNYKDELQTYLQEFLLPEVDRQYQLDKIDKAQEKWLTAGLIGKEASMLASKKKGKVDVDAQGVVTLDGEAQSDLFEGVDKETEKKMKKEEKK